MVGASLEMPEAELEIARARLEMAGASLEMASASLWIAALFALLLLPAKECIAKNMPLFVTIRSRWSAQVADPD